MILSRPEPSAVFSLVLGLRRAAQEKVLMLVLFQMVYLFELVAILVVLGNYQQQPFLKDMLQSVLVPIGLGASTAAILLQLAVAWSWGVHLQLYNQLVFFRYCLFPLLMLFLAAEIAAPHFLPIAVSYALLVLLDVGTFLVHSVVFHECSTHKIVYSGTEYTRYCVVIDLLMVMTLPLRGTPWLMLVLIVWAVLAALINWEMRAHARRDFGDKWMGFISLFKLYLLLLLIAEEVVFSLSLQNQVMVTSLPIFPALLVQSYVFEGKETLDAGIFAGEASLLEFTRFLYIVSDEIYMVKGNLNVSFEHSYLMLFIAVHKRVCKASSCLLHHPSVLLLLGRPTRRSRTAGSRATGRCCCTRS
jgi:hypothetical protein